jgi:hypothetical protein
MAWGAPHLTDGPSVRRQIVRATVGTLTVIAVIGGLVALVVNGARPAAAVWWSAFGDRDVFLGDGVVLSDRAPVTSVPLITARSWELSRDLATVAAPLCGGGVPVTSTAELRRLAPWFEVGDGMDGSLAAPTAVLPAGVLQLSPSVLGAATGVRFMGGPDAPVASTPAQREALVLALEKAWGVGSSAGARLTVAPYVWPTPTDRGATYGVRVGLAECPMCDIQTYDNVTFGADGRLMRAQFVAAEVTGSRPQQLLGAGQVFDDVRRHREDWYVETGGNPITAARLLVADVFTPEGIVLWQYELSDGAVVAIYPADPAFITADGGQLDE